MIAPAPAPGNSVEIDTLTAIAPVDGRYAGKVETLRPIFSEQGLIHRRIRVEVAWLRALAREPAIGEISPLSAGAGAFLDDLIGSLGVADARRVKEIESTTNHDVKAIEYYLKQRLQEHDELAKASEFVHFACTSEDINNVAYALMLTDAREQVISPACIELIDALAALAHSLADAPMLSRTHGQSASPTTMGKEIANVVHRLRRAHTRICGVSLSAKMNGAVGNFNAHRTAYPDVDWPSLSRGVIESLGLEWNRYTTQIEPHDDFAALFDGLAAWNTICLDFCRDIWSYISLGYLRQKLREGEVGSSTMPHKVNPIDFENAEGNLGVANASLRHLADKLPRSRMQRDLTDSTVQRTMGVAIGHAVIAHRSLMAGVSKLAPNRDAMAADLNDAWEVLAEPIQMVMRRYGLPEPYEQLKALTRGRGIDRDSLREFVEGLDLPGPARAALLDLTPAQYIGDAAELASDI